MLRSGRPHPVHIRWKVGDKPARFRAKFVDKTVVGSWAWPVHFVLPEGAGANRQTVTGSDLRDGPGNRVRWPQGHRMRIPGRSAVTPDLFGAAANRLAGPPTSSFGRFVVLASSLTALPRSRRGRVRRRHTNPTNVHDPFAKPTRIVDLDNRSRSFVANVCLRLTSPTDRPNLARARRSETRDSAERARPNVQRCASTASWKDGHARMLEKACVTATPVGAATGRTTTISARLRP
jgi:hypothetical protein